MDKYHQEVWYENDQGVTQRVKVCPGTDWPFLLKSVPGARVMNMERKADGLHATPYETPKYWAWGGWDFEVPPLNPKVEEAHYEYRLREAENFARLAEDSGSKKGRIVRFTRFETLPDPKASWEAPACEMCGCRPWILTTHPLNKKSVCLECKSKGTEGWAPCPATHKDGASCVLCRATPGFIEVMK